MDLPVVHVSQLQEFKGDECQLGENKGVPFRWAETQAGRQLESRWDLSNYHFQPPHHMFVVAVDPAAGCEPMNLGICAFLAFIEHSQPHG
jgi:hypothetical protein